jgi:hypothetical protein
MRVQMYQPDKYLGSFVMVVVVPIEAHPLVAAQKARPKMTQ